MKLVFPSVYAIMDAVLLRTSELAFAEMMAKSGVELIQYRNKQAVSRTLFQVSQSLAALLKGRGVRVIVNDRPDIAVLAGAGGTHVGQEDLGVEEARAICGAACWVGVSTHTLEQVAQADKTSADYVAVGPIFPTLTKEKPGAVVGVDFVRQARELTQKPLVAIGGITLERAGEVFRAGADSIAVGRDVVCAADPAARARQFLGVAVQVSSEAR